MRTIWKFPFEIADEVEIEMPCGVRILHVEEQGGKACMWGLVNTEADKIKYKLLIFGTGQPIPDGPVWTAPGNDIQHIGTFQMKGGALVFHMFLKPEWMQ